MSSDRTVVVASLVWLGALVALSRQWVGDIRSYITKATHGPQTTPSTRPRAAFDPNAGGGGGELVP